MASRATFGTQADALFRKSLTYQKRKVMANIRLVLFPVLLCALLAGLRIGIDKMTEDDRNKKETACAPEDWLPGAVPTCAVTNPQEWPPHLQLPRSPAVRTSFTPFEDLPDQSCRLCTKIPHSCRDTCPVTMLFTGNNKSFAEVLSGNMFPRALSINDSDDIMNVLATSVTGTTFPLGATIFYDPAYTLQFRSFSIYYLQQNQCADNSSLSFDFKMQGFNRTKEVELQCQQGLTLWRNSPSVINDELYKGYHRGNNEGLSNEIAAAFDFLNSNNNIFNVSIWYNATYKGDLATYAGGIENQVDLESPPILLTRLPRSINMISNAYLQYLLGPGTKMLFEFVKEMPKSKSIIGKIDLASTIGAPFFTWVVMQLFPVILTSLVYEKQQKLRIMMKMHGLGDGPYWLITYGYFLAISVTYMLFFVLFGSLLGVRAFTANDYSVQFVFYFIYVNLQISMAFLAASMFSNVTTATVIGYVIAFGTGLIGGFFTAFARNDSFPRAWVTVMELYPGLALYRGISEFGQYAAKSSKSGDKGMTWKDMSDSTNGMKEVLIIMLVESIVGVFVAYYFDQVFSSGSGKSPLFFLEGFQKKSPMSFHKLTMKRQGSKASAQTEKSDVIQEREKVEQLLLGPSIDHAILCDNLQKVYPGEDGNPPKFAVRGMFLAMPRGECLGMLGPNGAGKTSFLSMMIGLTKPSAGTAYVQGMDIRTQMDNIHTTMGVCPQHDLLWDSLTGREHLLFYGRLKNLKGSALTEAVEESLKSLNLFHGGVADKRAGQYSGGMKRRLSVAISLIGNPGVVYLDEPSTGLDPASRSLLWNVIRSAKKDRAFILTTHSMEEAEALCDRIGIFVDGSLQCIGNAKELRARYGGVYVFTMTTSLEHEKDVENMVQQLSPNAKKVYHLSGTQKFELPKGEVRIADVFRAVDYAKRNFTVSAWGLAEATLEDVFIKVATGALKESESLS